MRYRSDTHINKENPEIFMPLAINLQSSAVTYLDRHPLASVLSYPPIRAVLACTRARVRLEDP